MVLSRAIAAALLVTGALAVPPWVPPEFRAWAAEYGKKYSTESEWSKAYHAYQNAEELIKSLRDAEGGTAEYGHTKFSDLTPHEWHAKHFGKAMDPVTARAGGDTNVAIPAAAPDAVDWRTSGAVTPVKNQGSCGSCWAESAVQNIESAWYLANKATMDKPVPLSTEQVIECDEHDYSCYGGFPKGAYEYAIESGGLASEADYAYNSDGHTICLPNQTFNATCGDGMCDDPPLTSYCDLTCSDKSKAHKPVAKISSWKALPENETEIASFLAANGPVSVGIDAAGGWIGLLFPWLQFYKKGVANPKHCTKTIDHAVLLVGYGTDNGTPYWIIKNSWGEKWGEEGYFRMIRNTGACGVDLIATSAVVTKGTAAVVV